VLPQLRVASSHVDGDNHNMSNREIVLDLVSKLPEDAPLDEIARKIELLAGIQAARNQARRNEGTPAQDAHQLVDAWLSQSS
jgi:hypothetical protein